MPALSFKITCQVYFPCTMFIDLTSWPRCQRRTYSVELERARNFFPFSFLRFPLRFPGEKQNINTHFKYKHAQWHLKYLHVVRFNAREHWDVFVSPKTNSAKRQQKWLKKEKLQIKFAIMIKTFSCICFGETNTFLRHPCEIQCRRSTIVSCYVWGGICVSPCHELLLGRPFSQMSEMCLASGILSLHEWDRPLDLHTHRQHWQNIISTSSSCYKSLFCSCCISGDKGKAEYEDTIAADGTIMSRDTISWQLNVTWYDKWSSEIFSAQFSNLQSKCS